MTTRHFPIWHTAYDNYVELSQSLDLPFTYDINVDVSAPDKGRVVFGSYTDSNNYFNVKTTDYGSIQYNNCVDGTLITGTILNNSQSGNFILKTLNLKRVGADQVRLSYDDTKVDIVDSRPLKITHIGWDGNTSSAEWRGVIANFKAVADGSDVVDFAMDEDFTQPGDVSLNNAVTGATITAIARNFGDFQGSSFTTNASNPLKWEGSKNYWSLAGRTDVSIPAGSAKSNNSILAGSTSASTIGSDGCLMQRVVITGNTMTQPFSIVCGDAGVTVQPGETLDTEIPAFSGRAVFIQSKGDNNYGEITGISITPVFYQKDPRPVYNLILAPHDSIGNYMLNSGNAQYIVDKMESDYGIIITLKNFSSGGSTAYDWLNGTTYLNDAIEHAKYQSNPIFLCNIGTNSTNNLDSQNESLTDYESNLTALLNRLLNEGYSVIPSNIIASPSTADGVYGTKNTDHCHAAIQSVLPEFYDASAGAPLVDLRSVTWGLGTEGFSDNVHPNSATGRLMLDEWAPTIAALINGEIGTGETENSSLSMTISGIPDGTYTVDLIYTLRGELKLQRVENVIFSNDVASLDLALPEGTSVDYKVKTSTHYSGDDGVTL